MPRPPIRLFVVILTLLGGVQRLTAESAPAAPTAEIRIGVVAPLSGREAEWGKRFLAGVEAALQQANGEGAVPEGGRLVLEKRDCRGRASNAALEAELLCDEHRVSVLLPSPGCEHAARAVSLTGRLRKVPVLGAGCIEETRKPPARLIFSLRVSLADELGELLRVALKKGRPVTILALDEQTLAGTETLRAVRRSAHGAGVTPTLVSVAPGDLHAVRRAVHGLAAESSVLLVLPPVEAATAVRALAERSERPLIFSSSLAPAAWLARLSGAANAAGVVCALPLPSYFDERLPLARAYRAAMGSSAQLDSPSYEGFALVRLYLEGLRRAGGAVGGELFAAALETLDHEWEGLPMRFDTGSRQGLSRVWLVRLDREGSHQPLQP